MVLTLSLTGAQLLAARRLGRGNAPAGVRKALGLMVESGSPIDLRRPDREATSGDELRDGPAAEAGLALAPGEAGIVEAPRGSTTTVISGAGGHCADVLLFSRGNPGIRFDAARTRSVEGVHPGSGSILYSCPPDEVPLARIGRDTCSHHDLLFPMCTEAEYPPSDPPHPSCRSLLSGAAEAAGLVIEDLHDPLNLWLPSLVGPDGSLEYRGCAARGGDFLDLEAAADLLILVCPCADDLYGSSRLDPTGITVAGSPQVRFRKISVDPDAGRKHAVEVTVSPREAESVSGLAATGRFGGTPEEVLRAAVCTWATGETGLSWDPEKDV